MIIFFDTSALVKLFQTNQTNHTNQIDQSICVRLRESAAEKVTGVTSSYVISFGLMAHS